MPWETLTAKLLCPVSLNMHVTDRALCTLQNSAFVYYSGFTEEHLLPGHAMLVQKLVEHDFQKQYVCKKYANRKFLKASSYAVEWAAMNFDEEGNLDGMVLQE